MSEIFRWIGLLTCFGLVLIVIGLVLLAIIEYIEILWKKWEYNHEDITARKIGVRIMSESYWFSEDHSAMNSLKSIGEALRDNGYFDMSNARNRWQELNKKDNPSPTKEES